MNYKVIANEILEEYASCYSKVDRDTLARKLEDISKETAREILLFIGNMSDDCDSRFKLKDYQWHKNLCRKYGVEIKD